MIYKYLLIYESYIIVNHIDLKVLFKKQNTHPTRITMRVLSIWPKLIKAILIFKKIIKYYK